MAYRDPKKKAENYRLWREHNAARVKQKHREWYLANREQLLEKQKLYRRDLPPEIVKARRKQWAAQHRDKEKRRYHATRAFLPWLNAFRGSKARAKKHAIAFTITKGWCEANWTARCAVTDLPFELSKVRSPYLYSPSIDRIIPSEGYTPANSRFVLHAVNALKGAGTDLDMLQIATAIVQKAAPPMLVIHAPDTDLAEMMS